MVKPAASTSYLRLFLGGLAILAAAALLARLLLPMLPHLAAAWLVVEVAFWLLYWQPLYHQLNEQPEPHEPPNNEAIAQAAFQQFLEFVQSTRSTFDYKAFLCGWYRGAAFEDIRRGNAEDFCAYGFYYRSMQQMEAAGLGHVPGEMVDALEELWGAKLPPGHNPNILCMKHLLEPLKASPYPLAFYCFTRAVGVAARGLLRRWGFETHSHSGLHYHLLGLNNTPTRQQQQQPAAVVCSSSVAQAALPEDASLSGSFSFSTIDQLQGVASVATPAGSEWTPFAGAARDAVKAELRAGVADSNPAAKLSNAKAIPAHQAVPGDDAAAHQATDQQAAAAAAAAAEQGALRGLFSCPVPAGRPVSSFSVNTDTPPHSPKPGAFPELPDSPLSPLAPAPSSPAAAAAAKAASKQQQGTSGPARATQIPGLRLTTSILLHSEANPLHTALSTIQGAPDVPILFLHGVGGLPAYLEVILQLMGLSNPIIAIDVPGVSIKFGRVMPADEVAAGVVGILDKLGVAKACVVGHSYGTFIASYLLTHHRSRSRIHTLCLLDPVCCGMFLPQLLASALYSAPVLQGWSLPQLRDFVKLVGRRLLFRELTLCSTFARKFYWTQLNLWPKDLPAGSVVLLSGRDDLMNSPEMRGQLERTGNVRVLYKDHLDHGAFLLDSEVKAAVVAELAALLVHSGNAVAGLAQPVLRSTASLVREVVTALGGASRSIVLKQGAGRLRYVEDRQRQLVRSFTGNLSRQKQQPASGASSSSLGGLTRPGGPAAAGAADGKQE